MDATYGLGTLYARKTGKSKSFQVMKKRELNLKLHWGGCMVRHVCKCLFKALYNIWVGLAVPSLNNAILLPSS